MRHVRTNNMPAFMLLPGIEDLPTLPKYGDVNRHYGLELE